MVMRNDCAVHGAGIIVGNTTNNDSIGARRAALVNPAVAFNGEFQIWLLSVSKVEMFVVIVDVRVSVSAQSFALRGQRESRLGSILDVCTRVANS